jgi:HEAT repeat protein
MSSKQVMLGGVAVLAVILAVVMAIPPSRHAIMARVLNEPEEQDRYLYQWLDDLHGGDGEARVKAAGAIGNMGEKATSAIPDLIHTMLEDPEPQARSNAAFSLQKMAQEAHVSGRSLATGNPDLVPALTKALSDYGTEQKDKQGWVRMNAAMALRILGPDAKDAVPALIAGIGHKLNAKPVGSFTWTIREEMMIALGSVGPDAKDAVPLLKKALGEELDNTRRTAARALGRIGPPAKDALKELMEAATDDESEGVREQAREAIKLIDPKEAKKLDAQ